MIIIAYHDKCMDGLAAAWVVWNRFHRYNGISFVPMSYSEESYADLIAHINLAVNTSTSSTYLYVVDFSLPVKTIQQLPDSARLAVSILDHHKTAAEAYEGVDFKSLFTSTKLNVVIDQSKCGAVVTWSELYKHHYDEPMPKLLSYINDRDLWKFDLSDTRYVHQYLLYKLKGLDPIPAVKRFDYIAGMSDSLFAREVIQEGRELLEEYQAQVHDYCLYAEVIPAAKDTEGETIYSTLYEAPILEESYLLVRDVAGEYASDVGNELATMSPSGIGITYFTQPDGVTKYSLRSIGDVDVSAIAKKFGGGGHKNAAGYTINIPQYLTLKEFFDEAESDKETKAREVHYASQQDRIE